MKKDGYTEHTRIELNDLTGATEVGRPLYVTGNFGGFGGNLHGVHLTKEDAIKFIKDRKYSSGGMSIFEISIKHIAFCSNDGTLIED